MRLLKAVLVIMLTPVLDVNAAEYYRCIDASGNMIFSQASCGTDAVTKTIKESRLNSSNTNTPRSAVEQLRVMREIRGSDESKKIKERNKPKRKNDSCSGISSLTLRNARVGKKLMKCHTKQDVQSIYGSPQSSADWSDSTVYDSKWTYYLKDSSTLFIYFKNGRVTEWSIHR